ncbi:MAG: prepilin-type N-terminal cleavage/methylation domain-containing protein [Lysobacterales bacterium]
MRSARSAPTTTHQQGFTLLEVLAAFVVFALLFTTTLKIMSSSMRNVVRSSEYSQAALWAQTRMDSVGIDPAIEEGTWEGEFDERFRWTLDIQAYEVLDQLSADLQEFPVDLYYVELAVLWGEDTPRRAVFKTLRSATPVRGQ